MKRLAFIVIFLVGTAGTFQWLSQGFSSTWEPQIRGYLEENAGRLTKTRVHIDAIMPSFFHRVRLLNVRVTEADDSNQLLFQASEIELTVSLIDLPRALWQRKAYEAIGLIAVENPWIRFSPETLAKHASHGGSSGTLPPWFTLVWNGGTLQWLDARAPRGVVTLYQAQGIFRVRGPQMNFAIRGSVQEAPSFRFQVSSLAGRWNAQMIIAKGDSQSVLSLIQNLTKRPILPNGWSVRGGFHFEARASGRRLPVRGDDPLHYLDQATLTFLPQPPETKPQGPSIGLAGALTYKDRRIIGPSLAFESPWLDATGRAECALEGTRIKPQFAVTLDLPSGKLAGWPFQSALLRLRYADARWDVLDGAFRFLDGRISGKGPLSAAGSDLVMTAENVSLAALGRERGLKIPDGRINASFALKGPSDDWQLAGAWWLTGLQWGDTAAGEVRGDFEVAPDYFRAQAKSDTSSFRFNVEGNHSPKALDIDHLELMLPSGGSFSGEGHLLHASRKIAGTFDAARLAFPSDFPFLPVENSSVKGPVEAHARLGGTLEEPIVKGTVQSAGLMVDDQPIGKASANFTWNKTRLEIPSLHVEPGIDGDLSLGFQEGLNGAAHFKVHNAAIGKWSVSRGALRLDFKPEQVEVPELSAEIQDTAVRWHGKVSWQKGATPRRLQLEGSGSLRSTRTAEPWDIPFDISGHLAHPDKAWDGQIHFDARVLDSVLRGDYTLSGTADHPEGKIAAAIQDARWRAFQFSTKLDGVWSREGFKPLTLEGHFKSGGTFQVNGLLTPDGQAQGTMKLDDFNLRPLGESLRFPKSVEGTTSATLTLSGPLARLRWSGHLDGGPVVYAAESPHPFKLEQVSMDMTVAPLGSDPSVSRLLLSNAQAKTAEELIRFEPGSYIEFAGQKPAHLAVGMQIRNLHLGIFTLFGGLDMDGTWQIKPEGFALQTKAQTHSLFINDYELSEGQLLADYYNGVLKFAAPPNQPPLVTGMVDFHKAPQLKFTDFFISGHDRQGLQLSGDIGPSLWDFKMAGRGLDMGILGELAGFPYPLSGAADVQIHGTGDPVNPHVEGKVDLDNGTAMGLAFHTGSAAFVWQNARITFTKLLLSDPGHYNLEGAGAFPLISKGKTLGQDHSIDFSIRLRDSNLSLLQSFSQEVKQAKGPVEGLLQIKGTLEDPSLHGSIRVTNGEILGAHYFRQLRNANLNLDFDGDTVNVREIRGKSGEGEFHGSGTITLAGFVPSNYDLKLDVISPKGVDVQVPELAIPESPLAKRFKFLTSVSRCDVRGHVVLQGPAENPTFSGEAILSNGHFTFPPSHKNPPSLAVLEWFQRITWDVDLKFQDGAFFENELVEAGVLGHLKLKGPSDQLRVDGGLDIPEGNISYLGLQFDIQQARFDIRSDVSNGSVVNTPYVRGVAECQIQAVDTVSGVAGASGGSRLSINDTITLNIDYAPIDQIKPRLTSAASPNMSQEKLLARVTQTDIENLTPQERTYLYQKQIVSMIDSSLTTPIAQNVLKKTGLADRIRVSQVFDPNAATAQDLNNTGVVQQQSTATTLFANKKYTIEKDLSNRLSLGYGVRFVPSATSVDPDLQAQQKLDLISDVQLSYRWFRNVYLRGDFDLPTSDPNILPERKVTIEPRWRFGWWGNTNKDKQNPKPAQQ